MLQVVLRIVFVCLFSRFNNNNNNNNNTQLLSCHVSTDTVKTVGVESQARVVAGSSFSFSSSVILFQFAYVCVCVCETELAFSQFLTTWK